MAKKKSGSAQAKTATITVSDLTGGIDRRSSPTLLQSNRAQQLTNVRLSVLGRWRPRPGWLNWSTTNLGAHVLQGAQRIYLNGIAPFTVAAYNGGLYRPTDLGVWGSATQTGLSTSAIVDLPSDAFLVGMINGTDTPLRSGDGTTWYNWTPAAPVSAPTVSYASGGSLIDGDTYEASYSYVSNLNSFPSNASPTAQTTLGAPNLTLTVQCAASSDPQVTFINCYVRDVTAGEAVRRFAGTIANPGSGTVTFTLSTNTWATAIPEPITNNPPPATLTRAVFWKGRFWAIDTAAPARLRFSELFLDQSWPLNYYLDLPFQNGDPLTAIAPVGDTMVCLGTAPMNGVGVTGLTLQDFDARPLPGLQAGAAGPYAVALMNGLLVHAAAEGVFQFNLVSDTLLSIDFQAYWRASVSAVSAAVLKRTPVVYHARDKELRVGLSIVSPTASPGEYVYDVLRASVGQLVGQQIAPAQPPWTTTDRDIQQYVQWDGPEPTAGNRGRLFSFETTAAGLLNEESVGLTANGSNMIATYVGPQFTSELFVSRFLRLFGEYLPAGGTLGITITIDGASIGTISVNLGQNIAQFGISQFGVSYFGDASRRMFVAELPLNAEGRVASVQAVYTGQDTFDLYNYGLIYQPEPEVRGIV